MVVGEPEGHLAPRTTTTTFLPTMKGGSWETSVQSTLKASLCVGMTLLCTFRLKFRIYVTGTRGQLGQNIRDPACESLACEVTLYIFFLTYLDFFSRTLSTCSSI
jgi:hypothetical protein